MEGLSIRVDGPAKKGPGSLYVLTYKGREHLCVLDCELSEVLNILRYQATYTNKHSYDQFLLSQNAWDSEYYRALYIKMADARFDMKRLLGSDFPLFEAANDEAKAS